MGALASQFMALAWLSMGLGQGSAWAAASAPTAGAHPALEHVERGIIEMRTDPEASKRDADEALRLLQKQPDADLEIRARLLLCDYQAERDTHAAEQAIEAGQANAHKIVLARSPRRHHRGDDAAARPRDVLVGGAGKAQLEFMRPISGVLMVAALLAVGLRLT